MDTKVLPFDDNWRFHLGDLTGAEAGNYDDAAWRVLDLPHDWMIEQPRDAANPSGSQGGFFPGGVAWYRKHFKAPAAWAAKQVSVEFDGVYHNAECWLNDHYLGRHPYGYTGFAYALNRHMKFGAENVLTVRVDASSDPHTRWYSGSGIYRHVRLVVAGTVHIPQWGVGVTTPAVSRKAATVQVCTTVRNAQQRDAAVRVDWIVTDPAGRRIGAFHAGDTAPAGDQIELQGSLEVSEPALWSPDHPHCYGLETVVSHRDRPVDREISTFGIRWIEFSAKRGFVLNGEPLLMRGGCVHHDCGPLGAASIDRAEERKVECLKASGYNAVRCAHNPPAPAFLDACDRLGLLVIDEAFDVWQARKVPYDYHRVFDDWWQRDLESMLMRDRNHPSIVLWSIGNELIERDFPEGAEIAHRLADHVRKVEPTRPVTAGICGIWGNRREWPDVDDLFTALDVCGYNYLVDEYRKDHRRHPERIIVATETFPNKVFDYWRAVETMPWVVGDFVWTSLDYLGEAGIGRARLDGEPEDFAGGYPWVHANCGDIDLCGWKRPQSYYRDVVWHHAETPYIAVHPPVPRGRKVSVSAWGWHDVRASWNWPGCERKPLQVDVYFDCDEIELKLNGRSLGRRPATARSKYIASFKVPYEPGELRAVAYRKRRVVAEATLCSSGPAVALRLSSDRNPIFADRNDLAYVTLEAVDKAGCRVPDADPMAFVTVDGPATIAAIASPDPRNTEPYRGNAHSLWRGRALVIVQPTGRPGIIMVSAQSDQHTADRLKIEARSR